MRVIEPPIDDDEAPLPEGEVVALPIQAGRPFQLSFASPFESFLLLNGRRVRTDEGPDTRSLLIWCSRAMAALWRALEDKRTLLGQLVEGEAQAHDLCERHELIDGEGMSTFHDVFLDHGAVRACLEPAGQRLGALSVLGPLGTRADIDRRVRSIYAPGTPLEVRVEDGGRVVSRRRLKVGR